MIFNTPEPEKRVVDSYDFWFQNGQIFTVRVDKSLGDTIDFESHPTAVRIHVAAKPHRTNPDTIMPPEDITIFLGHLLTIIKKSEEVAPLTSEQQMQWQKTVQEIAKTTKVM